jgi:hypothetical protein
VSSDQRPDFGIVIDDDGVSKYLLHKKNKVIEIVCR